VIVGGDAAVVLSAYVLTPGQKTWNSVVTEAPHDAPCPLKPRETVHRLHYLKGLSGRVVSASDCGVRGSRFESRR